MAKLRALALIGASHELIASELGVSHDTLTRRFSAEVNEARATGKLKVLGKAFQMATAGNVRLLEIFLVNWLGFTLRPETVVNVQTNYATGQPTAAELRQRFLEADRFAKEHLHEIENGNGQQRNP